MPDCLPNFSLGVHRKLTQNQLRASPSLSFGDFSKRNLAKQIREPPAKQQWIMQPRYENSPQHSGIPGQGTLSPNAGLLKHLYFLDIDHLMIDTPATALTNADIAMVRGQRYTVPQHFNKHPDNNCAKHTSWTLVVPSIWETHSRAQ